MRYVKNSPKQPNKFVSGRKDLPRVDINTDPGIAKGCNSQVKAVVSLNFRRCMHLCSFFCVPFTKGVCLSCVQVLEGFC